MNAYSIIKKPFFGRYQRPWFWPKGVDRGDWQAVRFDNGRGTQLSGLYLPAQGVPKGSIALAHPMGTEAKGYYLKSGHPELLQRNGFHVLLFDFNGFGESDNGDLLYPLDVVAAAREAQRRAPKLPVGVLGVSFGASWTVCALAEDNHGIEAAVMESPFTTLDEYWKSYRVAYTMLRLTSRLMPRLAERLRPIVRVRAAREVRALLFIYGEKDDITPPSMGERFIKACALVAAQHAMWLVPDAKHTKVLKEAPQLYEERVVALFDQAFSAARAS